MRQTHVTDLSDGLRVAADIDGMGPPVLLIHGIPGGPGVWHAVAKRLSRSYRTIAPHLLGFGKSSRPVGASALWADAQAGAVLALLDDLEVPRAALVGHDFGGPVAAALLEKAPERWTHLALFATNAFPDTPIPFPLSMVACSWPIGTLARTLMFSRLSLLMMLKQGVGTDRPTPDPETYLGDDSQTRSIGTIFGHALCNVAELYTPIEASLSRNRIPAIVGWGDQDPFFSVEQGRRTAACVNGEFFLFERCGHFLPGESPDEVAASIDRLMRGAN